MKRPTWIFQRHLVGQSPLGIFTNVWPTDLCRRDRIGLDGWYIAVHVGETRLTILGC